MYGSEGVLDKLMTHLFCLSAAVCAGTVVADAVSAVGVVGDVVLIAEEPNQDFSSFCCVTFRQF